MCVNINSKVAEISPSNYGRKMRNNQSQYLLGCSHYFLPIKWEFSPTRRKEIRVAHLTLSEQWPEVWLYFGQREAEWSPHTQQALTIDLKIHG